MSAWDEMQVRDAARAEEIRQALGDRIDAVVAAKDFGDASAAKRGRNPRWPYVPVVKIGGRTQQLRGLAYATREEAVARAAQQISAWRIRLAEDLCRPGHRALREQHGLPREIEQ